MLPQARREKARESSSSSPAHPQPDPGSGRTRYQPMRTDRFTQRATEAIVSAQQLAESEGHPQLEVAHLLLVLVEQPDGVVPAVLQRIGVAPGTVAEALRAELAKLPKVAGSSAQLSLSNEARRVLTDAHQVAERMQDEYVSTEHLLLAAVEAGDSSAARVLGQAGVAADAVLEALTQIRGSHRVTNENPESTYEALEKYGRDLTEPPERACSTRSSAATRRSGASSRSSAAARRTTRCSSASRGRQDGDRRGSGPAHRARRRARGSAGPACGVTRPRRAGGRGEVPR